MPPKRWFDGRHGVPAPGVAAVAAVVSGAIGIGFAPVLVRLSSVGPVATAFWRIAIALAVLAPVRFLRRPAPPVAGRERGVASTLAFAGIFFAADLSLWHWALLRTSVANATVLSNLAPVFVAFAGWLLFRGRVSGVLLIGLAVAMPGAMLLVRGNAMLSPTSLAGDGLAVLSAVSYAGYLLTVKHGRRRVSALEVLVGSGIVSAPLLLVVAVLAGERIVPDDARGWLVVVALGVVCHVGGQGLIAHGMDRLTAAFSSLVLLVQPLFAALLGWVVLGETLTLLQGLGGALVVLGVSVGRRDGVERSAEGAPAADGGKTRRASETLRSQEH
jgi:drug/metabolite transporter (DMT)-like permease